MSNGETREKNIYMNTVGAVGDGLDTDSRIYICLDGRVATVSGHMRPWTDGVPSRAG